MEEVLISHQAVVEAAVVPIKDDLRGELPFGFIVLKANLIYDFLTLQAQLVNLIRKDIGPVACFRNIIVLNKLPKTRSGKILRYFHFLYYYYLLLLLLLFREHVAHSCCS